VTLEVLADARCQDHPRRSIGVVVRSPGGFPSWESRQRGRPSVDSEDPDRPRQRKTLFVNLRETSLTEVEGWCRDCRKVRTVKVADLLAAAHAHGRVVVLI
jgi:hypothetical protein